MRRACLRDANLHHADLRGAALCDADLESADLQHARLDGADLERSILRKVKANNARFVQARFYDADLTGGSFVHAYFNDAYYSDATKPTLPNLRDTYGFSSLSKNYRSARKPHLSFWKALFASKELRLQDAVNRCDLSRAEVLLRNGAKPNKAPRTQSGTVLHTAIFERDDHMLDALVRHGADLEARGELNFTPLQFAVYRGNGPAFLTLLRAGADRSVTSDGGRDLLTLAYYYKRDGMADLLARLSGIVWLDL